MARILIIEDDVVAATLLQLTLQEDGHAIDIVRDLGSAVRELGASEYDLVILEVFLSDGSGLDMLRHMRLDLGWSTPAIVLTGSRQPDVATRAAALPFTDLVTRPFVPSDLRQLVGARTR